MYMYVYRYRYMYMYLFKKYNYKWNSGPTDLMYRSVFYLFSLVPTSDWGNVWRPRATGIPSGFGKSLSGSPGQFVIFPDYMWQPLTCTEDPLWHGRLTIIDAETSVNSASWITILTSSVSCSNQVYFWMRINVDPGKQGYLVLLWCCMQFQV